MTAICDLISCSIIEKDNNNDVLWTWTFPSITQLQKKVLLQKCNFDVVHPFLFGRFRNDWFYLSYTEVFESDNLPEVKHFIVVLWTKDFNPEKYETLCRVMSKTYCKTGTPTAVLLLYLSVATRGSCTTEENGTFLVKDFEWISNNNGTMVKDLIKIFGLKTIIVYTVLLLKKRLVIYHHSLPLLLKWIRTFPALMIHRDEYSSLHPWVNLIPEELAQIKPSSCYIMGCQDSSIASHTELYDVLVNLPAREITVAPHAKESMSMTKTHKEIALFLVQLAEKEDVTESALIKEVGNKTEELLSQLRSLATVNSGDGRKMVTLQVIQERKYSQAVEYFLFQLALAENILML